MFRSFHRRTPGRIAPAVVTVLSSLAVGPWAAACLNDGTAAPCRCAMRMMVTSALAKSLPTGSPTLDGYVSATSVATASALSADLAAAAATQTVHVGTDSSNFVNPYYYNQADITINAGDTVHWIGDSGGHTVTSDLPSTDANFFDAFLNPGDTFDHTFNTPGVYRYHCAIHDFQDGNGVWQGSQIGTITVVAAPEPTALASLALTAGALVARRRRRS